MSGACSACNEGVPREQIWGCDPPAFVHRYGGDPGTVAPCLASPPYSTPPVEGLCEACGRDYPVWCALPHELWNDNADDTHFLCPTCFVARAPLPVGGWILTTRKDLE